MDLHKQIPAHRMMQAVFVLHLIFVLLRTGERKRPSSTAPIMIPSVLALIIWSSDSLLLTMLRCGITTELAGLNWMLLQKQLVAEVRVTETGRASGKHSL